MDESSENLVPIEKCHQVQLIAFSNELIEYFLEALRREGGHYISDDKKGVRYPLELSQAVDVTSSTYFDRNIRHGTLILYDVAS